MQPGQNISGPDVKKKNLENLDCSTSNSFPNLRKAINWAQLNDKLDWSVYSYFSSGKLQALGKKHIVLYSFLTFPSVSLLFSLSENKNKQKKKTKLFLGISKDSRRTSFDAFLLTLQTSHSMFQGHCLWNPDNSSLQLRNESAWFFIEMCSQKFE